MKSRKNYNRFKHKKMKKRRRKQKGGFGLGFASLFGDGLSSGFKASTGVDMPHRQRGGFFGPIIKETAYLAGRAAGAMVPKSELKRARR